MNDQQAIDEVLQRVAGDLSMIVDRELKVQPAAVQRATARAAGARCVHVSFKLGFQQEGRSAQGCLLMPLPDALGLAACLLMLPEEAVQNRRARLAPDAATKEALLEIGNFVGVAADAALRSLGLSDLRVRSAGCQGVKPDVRPALEYEEGAELCIGRAQAELAGWPAFELVLMLPPLSAVAVA